MHRWHNKQEHLNQCSFLVTVPEIHFVMDMTVSRKIKTHATNNFLLHTKQEAFMPDRELIIQKDAGILKYTAPGMATS